MSIDLLGVFGAGALTFLTPCVLPLVPVYLAAVAGGDAARLSETGRSRLVLRAAAFSLGFIAVWSALGLAASSIGSFLPGHQGALKLASGLVLVVFGLKFLGVLRIPWLDRTVRADDRRVQNRIGIVNAAILGVVFALGWTPCVGPMLASVLAYTASSARNAWSGAGYLAVYGLGMTLPLLLVAVFAEAAGSVIKKIGPYLPRIERAIGVLLIGIGVLMVFEYARDFLTLSGHGDLKSR